MPFIPTGGGGGGAETDPVATPLITAHEAASPAHDIADISGTDAIPYTPNVPGDWADPAPTTDREALDALAAAGGGVGGDGSGITDPTSFRDALANADGDPADTTNQIHLIDVDRSLLTVDGGVAIVHGAWVRFVEDLSATGNDGNGADLQYPIYNSAGVGHPALMDFNGDEYIDFGAESALANYCLVACFMVRRIATNQYVMGVATGGTTRTTQTNISVSWPTAGDGTIMSSFGDASTYSLTFSTSAPIKSGVRHMVVINYTSGNNYLNIWCDGVELATNKFATGASSNAGSKGSYTIGRQGNNDSLYLNGHIYFAQRFNVSKSDEEIGAIFADLAPRFGVTLAA